MTEYQDILQDFIVTCLQCIFVYEFLTVNFISLCLQECSLHTFFASFFFFVYHAYLRFVFNFPPNLGVCSAKSRQLLDP